MIIFINGSINSGKSTISKLIADKLGNTALIEIDNLRHFISWMSLGEAMTISIENAILLIKNFVKNNINVVVPYPLSRKNYDDFMAGLKEDSESIQVFTLSPKKEVALKNRGSRALDDQEKERIEYHYQIGIHQPDFGIIIDNSEDTPRETATKIMKIISTRL